MNLFAFSSILVVITNIAMAILVFWKGRDRKLSIMWGLFCILVSFWGIGGYKFSTAASKEAAFFWWQMAYICGIVAPVMYSHFVFIFLGLNRKRLYLFLYTLACIFLVFVLFAKELFFGDLRFVFNQFYCFDWPKYKSPIFLFFYIGFYWFLLLYTVSLLIKHFKFSIGEKRNQIKYLIFASIIGWLGAHGFFPVAFRVDIYPYSNFLIAVYPIIITYAMIRHHLMDIDIVIKRGLVYSVLATVITAGYLIFVMAVGRVFQNLVGYQSFIINLFAIFAIAILFNPLRSRIQRFLDRRFFKGTLESLAQERERLKENLFQAEKLAYVGNLASSVAHEIRNPLTAIKTFIEYFPQKSQDPEFKEKFQKFLPKEIERIERVVNQLLDLAKPRQSNFTPINIVNTIDTTLSLLENNLKLKAIEVKRDYQAGEALIQADEEQLKQVFLNLFLNALQAMNDGGILTISTSVQTTEDRRQKTERSHLTSDVRPLTSACKSVLICVSDTGIGISEANLKQLFTPFFTTKKEGVGLGLIVSQEIIKQHRGEISVESKIDEGTTFKIKLPIS